ncbi:MAG: vanadium-dependent haloperoxidase [Flavobacteriaceae bacterium]|jgi:hypothetical protein|nr:vanadium-dependent haloperoxidase [Flavobacteriaceae bacterium]MDO7575335.1 vanadium-dependent haloperoxidase [Flavobacteriaceae bacterium]
MKIKVFLFFILSLLLLNCSSLENDLAYKEKLQDPELFQFAMQNLTDLVVYDIFSPPVASRVYLYPTIAAYEVVRQGFQSEYNTLVGQVNGLPSLPDPKDTNLDYNLAALYAFNEVGKKLIFSEDKMGKFENNFAQKIKDIKVPREVHKNSKDYGSKAANTILEWASKDMYSQTRTFPKYTIKGEDKFWKPTPPDYMDGIEPHWKEIRTMVIDSSNQFAPKPPLDFDLTKGSAFQKQLLEVFDITNALNEDQIEIAKFWDCNPYVTHHRGHAMFATKKITPGGHWIGITAVVTRKMQSSFIDTVNAYTNVSIALFDAFISCWDEKWNTLIVRPETLINQYYDEEWLPLLQTPPFPEYTSGHSVISRAAAVILTDLYGDDFSFTDTTEVAYGLGERTYTSFFHAAEEAAISRLYGGIHYRMAIDEGVVQGQAVGEHIIKNLQTRVNNALEEVETE